jgi:hypothetical protein
MRRGGSFSRCSTLLLRFTGMSLDRGVQTRPTNWPEGSAAGTDRGCLDRPSAKRVAEARVLVINSPARPVAALAVGVGACVSLAITVATATASITVTGAYAIPQITIISPSPGASYERGSRIIARFRCAEEGVASAIATCQGSVAPGHAIRTGRPGTVRFVITAIDKNGIRSMKTIRYVVWQYVNPLGEVSGLTPRRIDLGVDYAGSGPLLALGPGRVTMASNTDSGPPSCWAISCWPGGGIVVYRLLDGPFAGKYVYVAEHIAVRVRTGQTVRAGQQIATLYAGYPWSEWGWAAGPGPEALGMADGHRCPCGDPGGWSTIDGRNMNQLLVRLGAPSGYLQGNTPNQRMPRGWPSWPK